MNVQFEINYDNFINYSSTEIFEEFLRKIAEVFYKKGHIDAMKEKGFQRLSSDSEIFWRDEIELI